MSFRKYLAELAQHKIQESQRYVIGNSSVDYDSFFGSIIMAFFLTLSTGHFHTPLIDCKFEQLKLRFEIVQVLSRLKIDSTSFRYRQQFHLALPHSIYNLYDHNVRKEFSPIEYVVDHHDLSSHNARKYLVDKMGSALTILYYLINQNYFQTVAKDVGQCSFVKKFEEFVKDEPLRVEKLENELDFQIKEIIRNGILLDTFNLDVKQQDRWTIFDKLALEKLNQDKDYKISFDELTDLKFDRTLNKNLTLSQSLTKDYKRFDYGGLIIDYSIIYLQPKEFYEHYKKDLDVWFSNQKPEFHIYLLMSIFKDKDGYLRREMMYRIEKGHEKQEDMFVNFLKSQKLVKGDNIAEWRYWQDPSVTLSRKKFDQEFRKYRGNHRGDL